MASIVFEGVGKRYADGFAAVKSLDLEIADGEFLVLVGPSGCGKSTALQDDRRARGDHRRPATDRRRRRQWLSPRDRDVAMVFQSYALYPHMTVAENIGFGLVGARRAQGGDRRQGAGDGAPAGARGPSRPQARAALRRPAAARGDGSRDRAQAEGVPDGRTAVEPRRATARPHALGDRPVAGDDRRHDDLRHA